MATLNKKGVAYRYQATVATEYLIHQEEIDRDDNNLRVPYLDTDNKLHHQMETLPALLALCEGNSLVAGKRSTSQWLVTRDFDVFFNLRLNKGLSKLSLGRWFETPSCPLWRHYSVISSAICRSGEYEDIEGVAVIPDPSEAAKIGVRFFEGMMN